MQFSKTHLMLSIEVNTCSLKEHVFGYSRAFKLSTLVALNIILIIHLTPRSFCYFFLNSHSL